MNANAKDLRSDEKRIPFESYKSNVCHWVKRLGDTDFVRLVIERDKVHELWNKGWDVEALYLLATVDYLCRINALPLFPCLNDLRKEKNPDLVFPKGYLVLEKYGISIKSALSNAIPEFLRHNIDEVNIRDVA